MKAPDRIDVARQVLGQGLTHPVTGAPFVPIAAADAFVGAPWWRCLALAVTAAIIVFLAWSHGWARLVKVTRAAMLVSHRAAEDQELTARIQRLILAVQHRPAKEVVEALREAMGIKRAVEDRLHEDGVVTEHEEEVGTMVGDLVRTMVAEAERLASTDGGAPSRAAMARFQKAAATLRRVHSEIDVILDPVPEDMRLPAGDDALTRASERLDERLKLARGIRQHLQRDIPLPDAPPAAEPAAPAPQAPAAES